MIAKCTNISKILIFSTIYIVCSSRKQAANHHHHPIHFTLHVLRCTYNIIIPIYYGIYIFFFKNKKQII